MKNGITILLSILAAIFLVIFKITGEPICLIIVFIIIYIAVDYINKNSSTKLK